MKLRANGSRRRLKPRAASGVRRNRKAPFGGGCHSCAEVVEQRLSVLQIRGVEALGEPVVDFEYSSQVEFLCDPLSADRCAHLHEQPPRLSQILLSRSLVAAESRDSGALNQNEWPQVHRSRTFDQG